MDKKSIKIAELEKEIGKEGFWNNPQEAGKIMQELEELRKEIGEVEEIEKRIENAEELLELGENEPAFAEASAGEVEKEIGKIEKSLNDLDFKTLFSGEYDRGDAIVSIMSGAGGVDAQDWSEMLLRMYLKWAERNSLKARITDESRGQEAGIKNATIEIAGAYAYGNLKSEAGVHRLVRLSPFNSDNLRQTSFALVEVLPVIEEMEEVKISSADIRVDVFRSSGAGGQSVNTTDSAVRITHLSTGTVVTCQNERSQLQNKETAMKILRAKLHKIYLDEEEQKKQELRGEQKMVEWGSQIRSYVIHPYKMVKDHRTKYETSDTQGVLEGNLKDFQEAYLRWAAK